MRGSVGPEASRAPPARAASLAVGELVLAYGEHRIISGVSLEVRAGQFVGLIGPNSSGKSTLLKGISRVLRPVAGTVLLDGRDLWREMSLGEAARSVAVVPQDFPADFPFTVEETVLMGRTPFVGRLRGEQPTDLARMREALAATGTLALRTQLVSELAGGDRQRVVLAKALAQEPRLLLLDEPTSHLDVNHQVAILDLLRRLNRSRGLSILIVLHDLNLASIYCDYLYLLAGGKLVAQGRAADVLVAATLEAVYGSRVLVGRHPVYGCPQVTLLSQIRSEAGDAPTVGHPSDPCRAAVAAPRRPEATFRVHVVAGGGSSLDLLEGLVAAGYRVTAGPLNAGDSDWELGRSLGLEMISAPPFSALERSIVSKAAVMMGAAEAVVVGPTPFGNGNVAVLQEVLAVARSGVPVGLVGDGVDAVRARDYTGGKATAVVRALDRIGPAWLGGVEDALRWLAGLTAARCQEAAGPG